jgi:hypothetical protein
MLARLDQVATADATRVDDAFAASDRAGLRLLVTGIAVVVVLLVVAFRLAVLSRRYVNVPLTAAVALVALFTVAGALVMAALQARTDDVRKTSYAATRALADARVSAYLAKAGESITLIRQNFVFTGNSFEDPAQQNVANVQKQLRLAQAAGATLDPADPLTSWVTVHGDVIAAVNKPDVPRALALATGAESTKGTSNSAFRTFEDVTAKRLAQESGAVDGNLTSGSWLLVVLGLVALVVGGLAAVASWIGLGQRLGEYR